MQKKQALSLIFTLSFLLFVGSSCQGPSQQNNQDTAEDTEQLPSEMDTNSDNAQALKEGIYSSLEEAGLSTDVPGKLQQVIRWSENDLASYLVISTEESGEFFTADWTSKIYMKYLQDSEVAGQYEDKARNIYSGVSLLSGMSEIVAYSEDLRGPVVAYSICPDGEDPCVLHVSGFSAGKQYDLERMDNTSQANFTADNAEKLAAIPENIRKEMMRTLFDPGFLQE
jgi:hypothetical protein